jgi:cytochrome c-type biogenesis protein CcmE
MVADNSIIRDPDGVTTRFLVTDGKMTVAVRFTGITPDLFTENSGVVAEGAFEPDGTFVATNILAKHDERYMPPQVAGEMHESKSLDP